MGWVAEWFKAPVLKTGVGASPPWVRIPPHPPASHEAGERHLSKRQNARGIRSFWHTEPHRGPVRNSLGPIVSKQARHSWSDVSANWIPRLKHSLT